jgi:hypothetical protein
VNYRDVIKLAVEDLDDFFDDEHSSQISAATTERRLMSATGFDGGRTLLIERFLAETPIASLEDVLRCLIMASHEICHLMNNHTLRQSPQPSARRALEMWADFFGARVAFTLITHGTRTRDLILRHHGPVASIKALPKLVAQERVLKACGNALDLIYPLFKLAPITKNYPTPEERMLTIVAGVTSFFYREFGELNERWTLYVYQHLAFGRAWFTECSHQMSGKSPDLEQFAKINSIHKEIAGVRASISPGLRPEYERLIGTGYRRSEKERKRAAKSMALEFSRWKTDFGSEMQEFLARDD